MSDAQYQPGIYVKGDQKRAAHTARDAVALVFDGFKLEESTAPGEDVSYRDLQAQAREHGIPANQTADVLRAAIAEAEAANLPPAGVDLNTDES